MSKTQELQVRDEVEVFKMEYPEYNDEVVSDYLSLCTDYTREQKDLFCDLLGF